MDVVPTVIYSFMLGIIALALVQAWRKPQQQQTTFLIVLLCLLFTHVCGELFIYSGAYQYLPALAGLQFPIRTLLGPALYFYARATMSPNVSISRRSYAIAALGPILVMVAMIPFMFSLTPQEKLALADPATRNPEHFKVAFLTCLVAMVIFIVFIAIYFVSALKVHARHRQQLMERFADIQSRSLDWFKVMLLLWGLVWFFYATAYLPGFTGWSIPGQGVFLPLLEAGVLLAFAQLALNQPILTQSDKGTPIAHQTRTATLSNDRMDTIASKLKDVMAQEALFMDDALSLNKLSRSIGVSENHISETLSQLLKTNFFHFVNSYRVQNAQQLLINTDKRVSTIQYEVGFNSKSTFNTAFKKVTGITPSQYRKQA
ncbi:AraC family transcriptional regulator [Pseudoalteromonas luteoviolacea]|uniref:AraC family transcriptional regulator n=1 Tax=Pseudoalteromonas luteoviolacea TaxID=43657 RepID=A0A1C0TWM7_9GAMM|nr:helix-turn-helix transcriptional regulator [Pseudoalteromonas luteoviolacea]MBQ4810230.1 helix-turn-helix transcriptional regulator [Pseudoalteromonas luteoviolacea]OCQ23709.1 AraC family transcriptional regulator [Pseudoalteromonas luteoviolacea]